MGTEADKTNTAVATEEKVKNNFSDFSSYLGEDENGNFTEKGKVVENNGGEHKNEDKITVQGKEGGKVQDGKPVDGEPKEEKTDVIVEEDIFLDVSKKVEGEGGELQQVAPQIDWKTQGMKLGIDITDNTEESFNKAFEAKINKARQEVNLDNYDPLTKEIITYVKDKNGDPLDFIMSDELMEVRAFMKKSDEDKYRIVRGDEIFASDNSKTAEEIGEMIDNELDNIDDKKFAQIMSNINNGVKAVHDKNLKLIIDKKNEKIEQDKKIAEQSHIERRNTLKSKITGMNSFVGMKLSDPFKNILLSQIENGEVDRFIETNQQEAMLYGYLHMKFGDRVIQYFNEKIKTDARQSYNTGVQKTQSMIHNIPEKQTVTTGHASPKVNTSDKPGWKDINIE